MISTYGDESAIGIFFLGSNFVDYGGVGGIYAATTKDVCIVDDEKGIRNLNALAL